MAPKAKKPVGAAEALNAVTVFTGVIVPAIVLVLWIFFRPEGFGDEEDGDGAAATKLAETSSLARGLLSQFSQDHNESLLWGTYRPGVLFGVKSRTFPDAVVAGLMWTSVSKDGARIDSTKLRHTCEESESREGLVFGYSKHDGSTYGKQTIKDPQNSLKLDTSFVKLDGKSWAMRVAGQASKGSKSMYFYVGIDQDGRQQAGLKRTHEDAYVRLASKGGEGKPAVLEGTTPQLGAFRLSAFSDTAVVSWAPSGETDLVGLKNALLAEMKTETEGKAAKYNLLKDNGSTEKAGIVVLQTVVEGAFTLDIVFEGAPDAGGSSVDTSSIGSSLEQKAAAFSERFEKTFKLRQAGLYSDEEVEFAEAAMSAMIGGLGYFYGASKVKTPSEGDQLSRTDVKGLFTAVPSRSFFPRGFLWDEGFHQLLIGRWDPAISRDVIAHWFGTMQADGWIPREQILGAEAESKVPEWAIPQHRTHANPPTFLLAIESLLEQSGSGAVEGEEAAWLKAIFPAVEKWFQWFLGTQKGELSNSFRWRGRDPNDGKLNAMTLSSGLDDYPRATAVSDSERHVDLHSWMALGAAVVARLGERAGMPATKVEEYKDMHTALIESLDALHWDDKRKRYSDYGKHSNDGTYVPHIVIKCAQEDGSDAVEHGVAKTHYVQLQQGKSNKPPCPEERPRFMFPLGDGQGGLLMREKFVPKKEKDQFVDHVGYVSLFPLLLRLISADSERLGQVLELLEDEKYGLWSDFGLRSVGKGDKMYLRENAPGDAPYWRGPIWININFLAVNALKHYSSIPGPYKERASELYKKLSSNLVKNIFENYKRTGYLWEQYNQEDGKGQRTHPFNGWSSLVVLMMAS
eukprot:TRINITY_DN39117_c0_g1_i1.p1 TRINITY_DN39117_c0_g1~~TRINITY_DN39117_c0_g1_i1.p1  ORF type:complete len:855 (-),score=143.72 TRINITY_DN39117_c0_g1_i1:43-2607(-)